MYLYLGRHGETIWNRESRVQGNKDIPLNEKGISLALESAAAMKREGLVFDRAFTSPLNRAYETARILLDACGAPQVVLEEDDRLREFCFGEGEGELIDKIRENPEHPMYPFLFDPDAPGWPAGAETFADVRTRFAEFIREEILPLEGSCENILILTHGGLLREALDWICDRKRRGYVPTAGEFCNCSFNIVECLHGELRLLEGNKVFY